MAKNSNFYREREMSRPDFSMRFNGDIYLEPAELILAPR